MVARPLLQRIEAPQELLDWLGDQGADPWGRCPRADWLAWLAASEGWPLATLLDAACDCVAQAVDSLVGGAAPLYQAIVVARETLTAQAALSPSTIEDCIHAADDCDVAAREYPASYRAAMLRGYPAAARAAAWLARAAEGLTTAEARSEAARLEEGQTRGLMLGAHPAIMVPAADGPARLDPSAPLGDPVQAELVYALAAIAQAIEEAARALAPTPDDVDSLAEVRLSFADRLRDRLAETHPDGR